MLVRTVYLALTHAFAVLRLLPMTDDEENVEAPCATNSPSCDDNSATNAHSYGARTEH